MEILVKMKIFRSFWFYFNAFPVLFGIFAFYKIKSLPPRGNFKDAMEQCKDVDNEKMLAEGTEQDYCIDNFMMENFTAGFVWTFFITVGLIFLIPLSIYLILSWKKHRYGHY